jgi:hypothetical protein
MRSNTVIIGCCWIASMAPQWAQTPQSRGSLKIDFPKDSPVSVVSPLTADWGQSNAMARGGALLLDLHTSLSLRNASQHRIRGITLVVLAQEVTPGGKGSVSVPSIDIAPDETFPVRIDLRLLKPLGGDAAVVQVGLDGILFDDLSFYGPNRLNSRRSMTVWELEAQRDRRYFKSILERAGAEGLQKEMLASLSRQADRPQIGVQLVRGGRATNYDTEQDVRFAFLHFPDAPIEPMGGVAHIAGNEAHAPRIQVQNRSTRPVRYAEIGWIVQDQQGREYMAGSVPAELDLAPGQKTEVLQDTALRFPQQTAITGMTGFVNSVEYTDGRFWIPSRAELASDGRLQKLVAPSPEEQRLVQIYHKKGLKALIEELNRF